MSWFRENWDLHSNKLVHQKTILLLFLTTTCGRPLFFRSISFSTHSSLHGCIYLSTKCTWSSTLSSPLPYNNTPNQVLIFSNSRYNTPWLMKNNSKVFLSILLRCLWNPSGKTKTQNTRVGVRLKLRLRFIQLSSHSPLAPTPTTTSFTNIFARFVGGWVVINLHCG